MREYFYKIDISGRLSHEGSELTDGPFLDFFFKRLEPNHTGRHTDFPFVSPCGGEMNYVQCAGAPVVFHSLTEGRLRYAASLAVPFDPAQLRFDGRTLLHPVRPGVMGRPSTQLAMELGRDIVPTGGGFAFKKGELLYEIQPLIQERP